MKDSGRSLREHGYEKHRKVLEDAEIVELRDEVNQIVEDAGAACVRHLAVRSERIDVLSRSETLLSLLPDGLSPVRSILFDKTEGENWPVRWHQDLTIAVSNEQPVEGYGPWSRKDGIHHVQPPLSLLQGMVTIRLHLDDTPEENGPLWVIPGSHRAGVVSLELVADAEKEVAEVCVCQAGDALLMKPLILHSSRRSLWPNRRRVIHLEYARLEDLDPRLQWFERSEEVLVS